MTTGNYLHLPFFENSHRQLKSTVESWAEKSLTPLMNTIETQDVNDQCRQFIKLLSTANILDRCLPGSNNEINKVDLRAISVIRETLAYYSDLADFSFAIQGLSTIPISMNGTEQQKETYVTPSLNGEKIGAFALSEPAVGTDVSSITTSATIDGDHFILQGIKTWTSLAEIADYFIVFARVNNLPSALGIAAFIVDATHHGVEVSERIELIEPRPFSSVSFNQCRLHKSAMLGQPGKGFKIAMETLDLLRPTVGAAAIGFAHRALDEAITWCQTRKVGNQLLMDMQLTQARLADMAVSLDASALLVYRSAWQHDTHSSSFTAESAMAKLYATETAQKIIDDALQLFGARGVVSGFVVEKLYRQIRSLRIYEGTSEIQKLIIARQLLLKK